MFLLLSSLKIILVFIIFFLFLKINKKLSVYLNLIDIPDQRLNKKIHTSPIPITGGIFLITILILNILSDINNIGIFRSLYYIIFFFIIFIFGILDDKYDLNPTFRFAFTLLAITFFISFEPDFHILEVRSLLANRSFLINTILFSSLCITVLMISFNMIDGINGILLLVFLTLCAMISFFMGNFILSDFILLILASALLLIANLKNIVFLGSSGNQILALIIALALIKNYNKNIYVMAEDIFLLLIIPFIDLVRLFIIRSFRGLNPFIGDNNHYHHLLLIFYKKIYLVLIYYLFSIFVPFFIYKFYNLNFYFCFLLSLIMYFFIIIFAKKN